MAFFNQAINILQTLVVAIGAGLAVWGVINLLEGYGNDNPGAKSQGINYLVNHILCCLWIDTGFIFNVHRVTIRKWQSGDD